MSKVTRVIVLCPNGRRQTVNLTPNSSILQVLEEVCQKQNLNPDDFDICHYNKPLDLSLPVRFANLSNNAQLELQPAKTARKDCLITIGLQLESGERIMKEFVPSTSIWDVVEQCLSTKPNKVDLDAKGEPVCIYMRQKLVGKAIKETTLRSLGLTKGSAVIRLLYRNPEDISDQAHVSAPLSKPPRDVSLPHTPVTMSRDVNEMECDLPTNDSRMENMGASDIQELEKASSSICEKKAKYDNQNFGKTLQINSNNDISYKEKSAVKVIDSSNKPEQMSHLSEQKMELDSVSMDQDVGDIHYIGQRYAILYSLDDITDIKKADLPDEFFQLTVDDVKYLMEEFKKTRIDQENQPLLTKELRNRQILQKLGRFKQTVIRIYFPERLVLQAVFEAQETVQDVCNFIRNYLEDKSLNFYLYTTPPKEKKDATKTLIESMLIPAAVMYFGSDKHDSSYLMKSLREKISDPRAATISAYESRKQAICETEEIPSEQFDDVITTNTIEIDADSYKVPGPSFSQASSSAQVTQKVPKWLKLSKK